MIEQENLPKNCMYDIKQGRIQVLWWAWLEFSNPENWKDSPTEEKNWRNSANEQDKVTTH